MKCENCGKETVPHGMMRSVNYCLSCGTLHDDVGRPIFPMIVERERRLKDLVRRSYLAMARLHYDSGETDSEVSESIHDGMTDMFGIDWIDAPGKG